MTITTTVSRVDALGNGSATLFSYSPLVITQISGDLDVWLVDNLGNQSQLVQGLGPTQFGIVQTTFPGTGSVTYPGVGGTVLPSGWKLVMKQRVALLQNFNPQNQGPYLASSFGAAFDYLMLAIQNLQEQLDRCVLAPEADPDNQLFLPNVANRENQFFAFDSSGNPTAVSAIAAGSVTVSLAMQPVLAAANVQAALTLLIASLPTSLPATTGVPWNNGGVLSIS